MDVGRAKRRVYVFIECALLRITDTVICVSQFEKRVAVEAGLAANKLRVVYNGVPRSSALTLRQPGPEGVINLIYVGRLDHAKGFDILMDVIPHLPSDRFHLTVVGEAVERQFEKPSQKNVTYTGWLSPSEVQAHIAASDVLVVPSRWESFCLVAAEAQVMGLAVVAGDRCSLPEIVENGKTGILFSPHDPAVIAHTLLQSSLDDFAQMGIEASRVHRNRFTLEEMNQLTLDAYTGLV
jgi:glycosyltransferase involved in cell wall biosynthesis